jgi:hypothetical protein
MRVFRILMVILVLATLMPFLSMLAADAIARFYGCELDLASVKPCLVGGRDIGEGLFTLGMMGWFLFATMPAFLGLAALWALVELVRWLGRRRAA